MATTTAEARSLIPPSVSAPVQADPLPATEDGPGASGAGTPGDRFTLLVWMTCATILVSLLALDLGRSLFWR